MSDLKKGDEVSWNWGGGHPSGKVDRVEPEKTTITSKGKNITRNGTEEDPAVVITRGKGNPVVKLAHELNETDS